MGKVIRMKKSERKQALVDLVCRNAVIDECAKCVPTTWLDSLLSGPNKVGDLPARETEALLRGIRDRIRALKSGAQ